MAAHWVVMGASSPRPSPPLEEREVPRRALMPRLERGGVLPNPFWQAHQVVANPKLRKQLLLFPVTGMQTAHCRTDNWRFLTSTRTENFCTLHLQIHAKTQGNRRLSLACFPEPFVLLSRVTCEPVLASKIPTGNRPRKPPWKRSKPVTFPGSILGFASSHNRRAKRAPSGVPNASMLLRDVAHQN